jgi:hypothetical protein
VSETTEFIARIEQHTGRPGKRRGAKTRLLCPGHDDHTASLDVEEGYTGKPVVTCWSHHCTYEDICRAIGWNPSGHSDATGEWTPYGPAIATYPYHDETGKLLYEVCRTTDKQFPIRRPDATSKSGWRFNLDGVRRVPYRLREVIAGVAAKRAIFVTEGEKHADLLHVRGLVATTAPMGAGKWRDEYADMLAGAARVFVLADDDTPGRQHAETVARSLVGRVGEVKIVKLYEGGETGRDVIDFYAAHATPEEADRALVAIVESTPVYASARNVRGGVEASSELSRASDSVDSVRGSSGGVGRNGVTESAFLKDSVLRTHTSVLDAGTESSSGSDPDSVDSVRPFALPIREFAALKRERREPMLAAADGKAVVGFLSLVLLGSLGGHGKTTWSIDLFLHMAAGVDYPPFVVPRPVSILLIENEGPEQLFADKLAARLEHFPHGLKARLDVCTLDWGGFSLADPVHRERLIYEVAEKKYDLVFGDPLDSLGIEGVGSPEDTRKFLALMKQTGLNSTVAWWLNTHPRKEETKEALNEIRRLGRQARHRVSAADARRRPDANPPAEAALGASRERPDAPVRVRSGDGGLQLHRRAGRG